MRDSRLPTGEFRLIAPDSLDWPSVDCDSDRGYLLEVDVSYPQAVHDYLDSFPPLPERRVPPGCIGPRLLNDLLPKKNYVLNLDYLQLVLRLGGVLDRVHAVVQFKQTKFLRPYISKLCDLRKNAPNPYLNTLYKMLSNILAGKAMEVQSKHKDIRVVGDERVLAKLLKKGNFIERHIITFPDVEFCIVELAKRIVVHNRPLILGAQILSLAKVYMLKFYYDVLVPNLPPIKVILVDTDSIAFRCETDDIYRELAKIKQYFDFSNLPDTHFLYSRDNCKEFLFFKDECAGKHIKAFCTPRTKCYSILFEDDTFTNKLKGVQRSFVRNKILFDHYRACVVDKKTLMANFKSIISKKHNLFTVNINKLALEPTDHKRVSIPNSFDTLAYGHYKLDEQ
jgi:hypothetical protein